MPVLPIRRTWIVAGIFVLLLFSLRGFQLTPFYSFWGFDLYNLHIFHNCAAKNSPYGITGQACGEVFNRPIVYPPLLYWSFAWVRGLSLQTAFLIWAAFIALCLVVTGATTWVRLSLPATASTVLGCAFVVMLVPQFPSFFQIERGNSDILVLVFWSASFLAFSKRYYFIAGVLAGLSAMYKLYPIISCLLVAMVVFTHNRKIFIRFSCGGALALLLALLFFPFQSYQYFTVALPEFNSSHGFVSIHSHSLPGLFKGNRLYSGICTAFIFSVWLFTAATSRRLDIKLLFAGALAMSTYYAVVSYDYNLITTYPLLIVLFCIVLKESSANQLSLEGLVAFCVLLLGLIVIIGDRRMFIGHAELRVWLQVLWLVLTPLSLWWVRRA